MSKSDFENILNKHNKDQATKKIDWDLQKQEWLMFIKQFYDPIESWLNPYVLKEQLTYKYEKIFLTEENIGRYEVENMIITFAGQQISLEPIGTLLIGSKGRIDMEGPRGRVQFLLVDKNSKGMGINITLSVNGQLIRQPTPEIKPVWTWKLVLREPRNIAFEEFNEQTFFRALTEVANG